MQQKQPRNNFKVKLVDFGPNGVFDGGDDTEDELTFTAPLLKTGNWVSIDISFSRLCEHDRKSTSCSINHFRYS